MFVLPPYAKGETGEWYSGTANAIFQNIAFIEQYDPQYVLVLSGDHIYKMDYSAMLRPTRPRTPTHHCRAAVPRKRPRASAS